MERKRLTFLKNNNIVLSDNSTLSGNRTSAVPKTITIKDLKNTGEVSDLCRETNEPVSIIRNGYSVLVIISIAGYEKRHAELWKDGD